MRLDFTRIFIKDIQSINSVNIKKRIENAINNCKVANSLQDIKHLKKLKGYTNYFRIDIGSFRLGLLIEKDLIVFSRCLPRKDIYKYFP